MQLVIKRHGGKGAFNGALARWIISLMPERCKKPGCPDPSDPGWLHYVEPYFGGGAVLLANDPDGISEVVNDLDEDLTAFWRVLRCPVQFPLFQRICAATEFGEQAYSEACEYLQRPRSYPEPGEVTDESKRAWAFFVRARQSLSGREDSFASITRNRIRGQMNEQASAWLSSVDGLPEAHDRMKRVVVLGPHDATYVIMKEDGPRTLLYLDPPYLEETRSAASVYKHEMTYTDHCLLLALLARMPFQMDKTRFQASFQQLFDSLLERKLESRFILSGYQSSLYDSWAICNAYARKDFEIVNNAAGGKTKRKMVESCYLNY